MCGLNTVYLESLQIRDHYFWNPVPVNHITTCWGSGTHGNHWEGKISTSEEVGLTFSCVCAHWLSTTTCRHTAVWVKQVHECRTRDMLCAFLAIKRAFSSRDHNPYTRNELVILVYNLYSMPLAVYAIAIKKPTGKRLCSRTCTFSFSFNWNLYGKN